MLLKVGDKAVVYANTSDHWFQNGDVVVIAKVLDDHYFAVIEAEAEAYEAGVIDYDTVNGWYLGDDDVFAYVADEVEEH